MMRLLLALIFTLAVSSSSYAQYCTSSPHTNTNVWIDGVTLNLINNTGNGQDANGYGNYTNLVDSLTEGSSYTLTARMGGGWTVYSTTWIDFNNDSVFGLNEIVLQGYNNQSVSGNFMVPPGTNANPTRMRVVHYLFNQPTNPCVLNMSYGEVEDYNIFIKANTSAPSTTFEVDRAVATECDPTFQFTDMSAGIPTSWVWHFGDGDTSHAQHPSHTYSAVGTYNVKLVTSNSFGDDSVTVNSFVEVMGAHSIPYTQDVESGITAFDDFVIDSAFESRVRVDMDAENGGVYGIAMGGNTWQNWVTPPSGQEFTANPMHNSSITFCVDGSGFTDLIMLFDLRVLYQYADNYTNFRVLVDGNQEGPLYRPVGKSTKYQTIDVDLSAYAGNMFEVTFESSCRYAYNYNGRHRGNGVYIDNINIIEPNDPPTAYFEISDTLACSGSLTVDFEDYSLYGITKWEWDFGNGDTSQAQNPTYTYTTPGQYTVELTVTNKNGSHTYTMTNAVRITNDGPRAAVCTPGTSNPNSLDCGIFNVTIDSLFHNTEGSKDMYQDYSCLQTVTVMEGKKYNVSIRTSNNFDQNVKMYIDFNNDGDFNGPNELVLKTDRQRTMHNTRIKIPAGAVLDTMLRVRVVTDYYIWEPDSCNNVTYGQVEDYGMMVIENPDPPVARFSADQLEACLNAIQFMDESGNVATGWDWDFGDGNSSTVQNPIHTYTAAGDYTVSLTVTNKFGNDSIVKQQYLTIHEGADSAFCYPSTDKAQPNVGIFAVQMGGIQSFSLDANQEGYIDFACQGQQAELIEDIPYALTVTTGSSFNEHVRVWIDWDNNTIFDEQTELVFSSNDKFIYHSTTITAPTSAVHDEPLRMRVASVVFTEPAPNPCDPVLEGQHEDYVVWVVDANRPPVPMFDYASLDNCTGNVQFIDQSINESQTWFWDFGDGNTSTDQNPSNVYNNPGTYLVKMIVTNSFGSDTLEQLLKIDFTRAKFSVDLNPANVNDSIHFTNESSLAYTNQWEFGDGSISTEINPTHTYSVPAIYMAKLTVSGEDLCTSDYSLSIDVGATSIQDPSDDMITIAPNPSSGVFMINTSGLDGNYEYEVVNLQGAQIMNGVINTSAEHSLDLNDQAKGIYMLIMHNKNSTIIRKLEIQ